ncbi:hypothetical protein FEM48_Zijuj08G0079300 [Ziziphus jujuba var. spinosa]|uniref:GRIP domain-containing protein n=1 Tax=Ziziphus jujuba var. spinosa TaxID=714518 RepID=A0A978UXW9_ZIZJJ|nr:hypothetical protein FEM48_Zijuj08G0079300 [Ziziphus jujuba var. spinosa]
MSTEGGNIGEIPENHMEDTLKPAEQNLSELHHGTNGNLPLEDGLCGGSPYSSEDRDQLEQMAMELTFQNEFLKSQFQGVKNFQLMSNVATEHRGSEQERAQKLQERIESLNKQLLEEKQTRSAAEEALKHLQTLYSEADAKAQELSEKLVEAEQKLNQEIKDREEKYSELDSKLNRLLKRAKHRIQEVQKVNNARILSGLVCLYDSDNIEELRHSLQPKESALEALQQTLLEKDQVGVILHTIKEMLEDMKGLLEAAEEKRKASIAELSAKHQKNLESLEAQVADALSDRNKATETISSLQVLVAEKESKIAEMEAASSGEAARHRAAAESVKGELAHMKHEHEKEKESWEAAFQALKTKLEISESNCIRAEIEAAKMRSQLESEVSVKTQKLNARDVELAAAQQEINRLESEFSSYKIRAHALLQKKDAELAAAKDSEQVKALEEALKEAEKEATLAYAEKERALQELQDALANHDKELAERDAVISNANQQIKSLETKLDSVNRRHLSDKEAWEVNLHNLEETWRLRCDALRAQNEASSGEDLRKELEELKLRYKKLKDEHASFRDLADRMIEEKDREISRLVDDNKNLQRHLESRPPADQNDNYNTGMQKQDASLSASAAEQQILLLARQQAQREEELAQSQRHILALQEEIEELERENRLHSQQEAMLKAELRNMERSQKREGVDMTYLKNVVLKLLETGEVEALLPVIGMLLQFSPEEIQKCQQAYRTSAADVPSPSGDGSGSARSLFSRFSFS